MLAGQLRQALADCTQALEQRPDDAAALDVRGLTYLKSNEPDKAIADFDAVLRHNPKAIDPLYGRGLALIKKHDLGRGRADTANAKALDPNVGRRFERSGIPGV